MIYIVSQPRVAGRRGTTSKKERRGATLRPRFRWVSRLNASNNPRTRSPPAIFTFIFNISIYIYGLCLLLPSRCCWIFHARFRTYPLGIVVVWQLDCLYDAKAWLRYMDYQGICIVCMGIWGRSLVWFVLDIDA